MSPRLGVLSFWLVVCLIACASGSDHVLASGPGVPLRVPVYRPSPAPNMPSPMAAQYCPPATTDPRTMGAQYGYPYPTRSHQQASPPTFTPMNALYSLLTIPFKLVNVATSHTSRLSAPSGPPPGYVPMVPPTTAPVSPPMVRYQALGHHQHTAYHYPPVRR
jgi:hypothetical protein